MAKSGKGSDFERYIAVLLSKWWTNDERDNVFWRSQNSGGRATTRGKRGLKTKGQSGDLAVTHPDGQKFLDYFVVELKRGYKGVSPFDLFDRSKKKKVNIIFEQFVIQAKESWKAEETKSWLLIHKRDQKETYVTLPLKVFDELVKEETSEPTI